MHYIEKTQVSKTQVIVFWKWPRDGSLWSDFSRRNKVKKLIFKLTGLKCKEFYCAISRRAKFAQKHKFLKHFQFETQLPVSKLSNFKSIKSYIYPDISNKKGGPFFS